MQLNFTLREWQNQALAAWTGASREAVSKALQLLRSLRIVETGRRHVTVLDPEALQRRAQ